MGAIEHTKSEPDKVLRESINNQLKDLYGVDTVTGLPMWRVSWSEDQYEKRHGTFRDFSPNGILLREITEVREVPKYRQWLKELYVLEHLVGINPASAQELVATAMSYEPLFPFWNFKGEYLPPRLDVCQFIVDITNAAAGKQTAHKYVEQSTEDAMKEKAAKLAEIQQYLWGNETDMNTSLAHKEGISLSGPKLNG